MNPNGRVAVLGASGFAGRAVVNELAQRGIPTIGTSRSRQAIDAVVRDVCHAHSHTRIEAAVLDVFDGEALRRQLARSDVVVNCVGPYLCNGEDVHRAAIETRTHYIDVASEQEFYRRVRKLGSQAVAQRCFVGVGLGAYPGLSGLLLTRLLRAVPDALAAEFILAMTVGSEEGGVAQVLSAILEMNFPLEELQNERLVSIPIGHTNPHHGASAKMLRWPRGIVGFMQIKSCPNLPKRVR